MNIDRIVAICAPWNDAFSHSKLIAGGVTGLHIMALVIGGGLAIAADRATLRVPRGDHAARWRQLAEVRDVHRIVLTGVLLLFVTGVLLAAADVETFLPSPIFWTKLLLVALLAANGWLLTRAERGARDHEVRESPGIDDAAWSRVRLYATMSVILWVATAVAGIVLSNA